jgi:hypothetical protein
VLFLLMPLVTVFFEAFRKGWETYLTALVEATAVAAIKLTLLIAFISVPLNLVFGVAAAWLITKFEFPRQAFSDHLHRSAFLGVAGGVGPDLRAGLRCPGLVRAVAVGARHQGDLRGAGHRAGHGICDLSLRGPGADSADGGPGP